MQVFLVYTHTQKPQTNKQNPLAPPSGQSEKGRAGFRSQFGGTAGGLHWRAEQSCVGLASGQLWPGGSDWSRGCQGQSLGSDGWSVSSLEPALLSLPALAEAGALRGRQGVCVARIKRNPAPPGPGSHEPTAGSCRPSSDLSQWLPWGYVGGTRPCLGVDTAQAPLPGAW